jgi:hypothetical protein
MPNNYVLLERIELNNTAASVTFDNIPPSGYTDLKLVASYRGSGSLPYEISNVRFNGLTTNLSSRTIEGSGSAASSFTNPTIYFGSGNGNTSTANTFSNIEMYVPNYRSSNFKSVSIDAVGETNATAIAMQLTAGLWSAIAAITSIQIVPTNSFLAGSTFSLYGLAEVGTTPAIAPKADGGNVIGTDGTYWYHAFLSNGTFTPQVGLSCDFTIVGGGGGGGRLGGGGGAGGFRRLTSQSLVVASYPVTIGAGGAAGTAASGQNNGFIGVASSINSNSSNPGGGGGGYNSVGPAGTYGSGGGGGYSDSGSSYAGASGTAGQGNTGGTAGANFYAGGGGGGAGANGSASALRAGGNGGTGITLGTDYINATGLGVSGFVAGGGGGSGQTTGGTGTGGGGNGANNANGTAGTVNTGGGGGGGYSSGGAFDGFAGGSGLVIIRYPVA